jgi:hypothetical protein
VDTLHHTGRCHCGNLSLRFTTTTAAAAIPVRECACSFCRAHRLRWTTDPDGRVEIDVADARELGRYRFGTETADFLVCRRCGSVAAAVSRDDSPRAVINVDLLACADQLSAAVIKDFDGEGLEDRLARRARVWTPVSIRVAG